MFDGKKLLDPAVPDDGVTLWFRTTHDCSSAVTGSAVFDFDGDGKAEAVYSKQSGIRITVPATSMAPCGMLPLAVMGEAALIPPSFEELYERIVALPQGITGEILVPGVLSTMSRPGKAHRKTAKVLGNALDGFDRRLGGSGWWIEEEAEIRFPLGRLAVPVLCGFRVERVPELPEDNPLDIVPDWCCEILSPRTAGSDRRIKLPLYATSGVVWNWLVDPERRTVEVFETIQGRPTLLLTAEQDERIVLPPFEGDFDLTPWWTTPAT